MIGSLLLGLGIPTFGIYQIILVLNVDELRRLYPKRMITTPSIKEIFITKVFFSSLLL